MTRIIPEHNIVPYNIAKLLIFKISKMDKTNILQLNFVQFKYTTSTTLAPLIEMLNQKKLGLW